MEGMSSKAEHDLRSTDEEGKHNVENFVLCSFAHHARSPLLQGFLHEEEICNVAPTCHFSLDVILLCQDRGGCESLELSLWHPIESFLTLRICRMRRQYEVVSLGFVSTCGQFVCSLLQRFVCTTIVMMRQLSRVRTATTTTTTNTTNTN